jgi:hypothetical protein
MTAMDELVTWLRAQLDVDEQVALAASGPRWTVGPVAAAKDMRRILDEIVPEVDGVDDRINRLIKLLAQPYAGRDGWREEWQLSAPA